MAHALFPDSIEDDPWILFHGTGAFFEKKIETEGLCASQHPVDRSGVQQVVSIYKRIRWAGSGGGSAVLEPFSLNHDFKRPKKPLFFAESSERASTFATRDFSGGEVARA